MVVFLCYKNYNMNKRDIGQKFKYKVGIKLIAVETDNYGCYGCYFSGLAGHKCYERSRGMDQNNTEVMYCGKGSRQGKYIIYKRA